MREKIELFKVLSETNRVRILMMLMQRELCVCEITSILQLSTATVSKHLSYLRENGFIEDYKDGKWIYYKIVDNPKNEMVKTILEYLPLWFSNEDKVIQDLVKVISVDRCKLSRTENRRLQDVL